MDDLSGLEWTSSSSSSGPGASSTTINPPIMNPNNFYPPLRPTPSPASSLPQSGRNTPLSNAGTATTTTTTTIAAAAAAAAAAVPTKLPATTKVASDSFSNLSDFVGGSAAAKRAAANLSLREQQERREAERRGAEEAARRQAAAQFGDNGAFWDALGQQKQQRQQLQGQGQGQEQGQNGKTNGDDGDEDLFAAFSASTKVDNSSYYPPPPPVEKKPELDLTDPSAWNAPAAAVAASKTNNGGGIGGSGLGNNNDDDDPFGLNEFGAGSKRAGSASAGAAIGNGGGEDDDDDLLGDLGKPVDEVRKKQQQQKQQQRQKVAAPRFNREPEPGKPIEDYSSSSSSSDSEDERPEAPPRGPRSDEPFDRAVAELVDYGFSPENARRGLTESGAGLNIQAAVNWLLDDAHRRANEKVKGGGATRESRLRADDTRSSSRSGSEGPARAGRDRDHDDQSPGSLAEGDFAKTAAAMGTSFLKTANSLWKTGQKRMQQVVAEFQQPEGGDPSQPKWMATQGARQQQEHPSAEGRERRPGSQNLTEEAMMLESGGRPGRRQARTPQQENRPSPTEDQSPARRGATPVSTASGRVGGGGSGNATPKWQADPRARISKQAIEEESSQAYVSPARRKKTTPRPQQPQAEAAPSPPTPSPSAEEPDLLFNTTELPASRPSLPSRPAAAQSSPLARQTPSPRPPPPRPHRDIPSVSATALQTSTQHRLAGTAHFKRGDYAAAHASYSASLAAVPPTHPLAVLLLCNRALTALKTGEPRQAVEDADAALVVIGPGKGEGESVELPQQQEGRADIDMRELYGKALARKAEALEQMEKWRDAGDVWQTCVEAGLGGAAAAAGRQRCQKALAPKKQHQQLTPPTAVSSPRPRPPASRPAAAPQQQQKSFEAVERLRAANEAAEREGDEKFALADKVEARIAGWRDGKRDNLRALLGSLDVVLWEGSGWKKAGMHELVVPGKVKIVYMRAIAKTHPDKIAQDASTEVRMIAATVFSTLNEAWDKFKAENGL